jgi:uncharacterized membrane protein YkoI
MEEESMRNMIIAMALVASAATAVQAQSITAGRARQIALARVADQTGIISEKLETRNGVLVYEFDIDTPGRTHREIRVDARTGVVVADQKEDDTINPGGSRTVPMATPAPMTDPDVSSHEPYNKDDPPSHVRVSEARAREIALKRVPNGEVRDIDLERENGLAIWEVEILTPGKPGQHQVQIDAMSGKVIRFRHRD